MIWLLTGFALLAFVALGRRAAPTLQSRIAPSVAYRLEAASRPQQRVAEAFEKVRAKLHRRPNAQFSELVELVDMLAVVERVLASGDSTLGAITWLGRRGHGRDARQFALVAQKVAAGSELGAELRAWQSKARSAELQDLLTKLISTTNSGADVVAIVRNLRDSVEGAIRAAQLAALGKSEMRMMIPIVFLVLPITVMFAVFPSLTLLNLTIQ